MDALVVALRQVPDPRGASTIFRSGSVLCIVAMALLSGNRDIAEIHRFGQCLKPAQRQALGLPRGKGKGFWRVPGYNVYYNLLCRLDLDRFATVLTAWLQSQAGTLPACLALLRSALLAIYARLRDMYGCLPAIIENLRANPLTVQRLVMGKL